MKTVCSEHISSSDDFYSHWVFLRGKLEKQPKEKLRSKGQCPSREARGQKQEGRWWGAYWGGKEGERRHRYACCLHGAGSNLIVSLFTKILRGKVRGE